MYKILIPSFMKSEEYVEVDVLPLVPFAVTV
jgi:hypothetical protein